MPYATHEAPFIGSEHYFVDMDLCDLLQTMKLDSSQLEQRRPTEDVIPVVSHAPNVQDELMSEDPSYQSDAASESSNSSLGTSHERSYGCAYLQVIQSQMLDYPTTGGEYLDAIFTHREILFSYPPAHEECARAFTDIAYLLEKRAWRADREADMEAVTAFRHEAWVIASSLAPVTTKSKDTGPDTSPAPFVCVMPMM